MSRTLAAWPDHDKHLPEILRVIAEHRRLYPNSALGVGTGWSGPKTLFDDRRLAPLKDWIAAGLTPPDGRAVELSAWANVMLEGDRIAVHDHERSHLGGSNWRAAVYCVAAPETGCARLVLNPGAEGQAAIDPRPGTLVAFGATVPHLVEPHRSPQPRITIAVNCRVL